MTGPGADRSSEDEVRESAAKPRPVRGRITAFNERKVLAWMADRLAEGWQDDISFPVVSFKPPLLDLFCGAGGAAMGYSRAGFRVVGVDIAPQPNYPFAFIQADALKWDENWCSPGGLHIGNFVAIHASPPCQAFTAYQRTGKVGDYPDLIEPVRELLAATGLPYVIENVAGAPLQDPLMLCGSMFDLDVQRHRYFESNVSLAPPEWPCRHRIWAPDRFPGGRSVERTGSSRGLVRACVEVGSWDIPLDVQQQAMGIDWTTLEELSEAIPPAYTELIGRQLLRHVEARFAAA